MRFLFITLFSLLFGSLWGQTEQGWKEHTNFMNNPGRLKMYSYTPDRLAAFAPLVVLLPACDQDPKSFAQNSGWVKLADREGFFIICAEQDRFNNAQKCFNWFKENDIRRGTGEVESIRQMIKEFRIGHTVKENKIYVAGFSSGGAMAVALLATYPDVFRAGAIFSGLPYGAATNSMDAMTVMTEPKNLSPSEWGQKVLQNFDFRPRSFPKLAVFHGKYDYTVNSKNARELVEQWCYLHQIDTVADEKMDTYEGNISNQRYNYNDSTGQPLISYYQFDNLEHNYPVSPGLHQDQGGNAQAKLFKNVGLWGSYEAIRFFEIIQ